MPHGITAGISRLSCPRKLVRRTQACLSHGRFCPALSGGVHKEDSKDLIMRLEQRTISPGQFFIEACDEKFTDEDLNDEGNAFTQEYFEFKTGNYLTDYERVLGPDVPTLYHVTDT